MEFSLEQARKEVGKLDFVKNDPRAGELIISIHGLDRKKIGIRRLNRLLARKIEEKPPQPFEELPQEKFLNEPILVRPSSETLTDLTKAFLTHIPKRNWGEIAHNIPGLLEQAHWEVLRGLAPDEQEKVKADFQRGEVSEEFKTQWLKIMQSYSQIVNLASRSVGFRAASSAPYVPARQRRKIVKLAQKSAPWLHESSICAIPNLVEIYSSQGKIANLMESLTDTESEQQLEEKVKTQAMKKGIKKKTTDLTQKLLDAATVATSHNDLMESVELAMNTGWKLFNASFHVDPFNHIAFGRERGYTLVMRPAQKDFKDIHQNSLGLTRDSHVPGSLAFAHFVIRNGRLIVYELQSDMKFAKMPWNIRKRYEDWQKIMLWKLKKYAAEKGLKEVWVTPWKWQQDRWPGLHQNTLMNVYGQPMFDPHLGFELKQTPTREIEGVRSKLFWVAKAS